MDLQKACEILEELVHKESSRLFKKLNSREYKALNRVLTELILDGKYQMPKKYFK